MANLKELARRSAEEITVYKSLGHVVQDLASAWAIYSQAEARFSNNIQEHQRQLG